MAKKYSIKIKLIEDVIEQKSFYEKLSDTGNERDNGPTYGYLKKEVKNQVESDIFSLELDELDIKKVVTALIIN